MPKKRNKLLRWFRKSFQLIIYHGKSYDVIRKFRFNRLGFIFIITGIVFILFTILSVFVVYTPIKQLIPGYPDRETRELIYENSIKTDSLLNELEMRDQYLQIIQNLVFNEVPVDADFVVPVSVLTSEQIKDFNNPVKPRKKIEDESIYNMSKAEVMPELFPPIKGVVVSPYNNAKSHFGTDIASSGATSLSSVLSGTVISSDDTIESGYTIIIQHKSDLISVYKHNKSSFVKAGDLVRTGSVIAEYGNTGEYTSGPHLHFELWRNGTSLNPENYIEFQ